MSQARASEEASTSQAGNELAARNEQFEYIRHLIYFLILKFEGITKADESKNNEIDLERSNIYADFLSTIFMYLRKMSNPDAAARGNDHGDHMCSYNENFHSVSQLALDFQEDCSKNGMAVKWDFKLARTLVDALTAFKMSWNESLVSAAKFKLRSYGQLIEKGINLFGLTNAHLPLLTGLTYKPERRSGLERALGPLTLAIMLSAERRMHAMMTKTLREALKDLPMGDSIVDCLRHVKGPEECRCLFKYLGDLLLIMGPKSSGQIFFPLLFVVKAGVANVEFSGVKGYGFYMKHLSDFTWKKLSKGTTGEVAQAVFHAMFGTAAEDLGVLGQITTQANWGTRKEIDAAYQTKEAQHVNFTPIGFKYFYKPAEPSLRKGGAMLINRIVFSARRKRKYSSAFLAYMERQPQPVYGTDVASLASAIARMKDGYLQYIGSGTHEEDFHNEWIRPDGSDANDFVATKSNKFFYT